MGGFGRLHGTRMDADGRGFLGLYLRATARVYQRPSLPPGFRGGRPTAPVGRGGLWRVHLDFGAAADQSPDSQRINGYDRQLSDVFNSLRSARKVYALAEQPIR